MAVLLGAHFLVKHPLKFTRSPLSPFFPLIVLTFEAYEILKREDIYTRVSEDEGGSCREIRVLGIKGRMLMVSITQLYRPNLIGSMAHTTSKMFVSVAVALFIVSGMPAGV